MKKLISILFILPFLFINNSFSQINEVNELSTITNNPVVFGIGVNDHYLYVNPGSSNIKIYDIIDPENPQNAGQISYAEDFTTELDVAGDYIYLYGGPTQNFMIFDANIPAYPIQKGIVQIPDARKAAHISNYSYVASEDTLYIVNTTDKENPYLENRIFYSNNIGFFVRQIDVVGNYLYLGAEFGIIIYDISTPNLPVLASYYPIYCLNFYVDKMNDRLYTCMPLGSEYSHSISDISDPLSPVLLSENTGGDPSTNNLSLLYKNRVLIQEGPAIGTYNLAISFYEVQNDESEYIGYFDGSITGFINDLDIYDSVFLIARNEGIQLLKYNLNAPPDITLIPDPNFEQALINLGYDSGPINGSVPTANISGITELSVGDLGISDLTGIQDFANLRLLVCYYNYLTSLDVSQNTLLTDLLCYNNDIAQLDVSNNPNLKNLFCDENNLISLNLNGDVNLQHLNCSNNQLANLDVSNNQELSHLYAAHNYLSLLDISNNFNISILWCNYNHLTELNVQNGSNTGFVEFHANANPNLHCIQVDNVTWSEEHWSEFIDPATVFSTNCVIGVDDDLQISTINIFPSPSYDIIQVQINNQGLSLQTFKLSIYNSTGKQVDEFNLSQTSNSIDISNYSSGLYFFVIKDQGQILETHKVMVE